MSAVPDHVSAETIADLRRHLAASNTERDEALARECALAEVLRIINSSPGDLAPVFEAMLEKGVQLCEARTGHLFRFQNGAFFRLASHGVAEDFDKLFPRDTPLPLNPNSGPARMIATRSSCMSVMCARTNPTRCTTAATRSLRSRPAS